MRPDPNNIFPLPKSDTVTYIKPTIKNSNIIVGEFTYYLEQVKREISLKLS